MKDKGPKGHIIFDHDGTLVDTSGKSFKLFLGMKELLTDLKEEGFILSVWTARPRQSTLKSLKGLEIASCFSGIYCFDDGIPKPHPMGLLTLNSGFNKANVLHIGDSMADIEGAKNFEIEVVAACWSNPHFLEKHLANYIAYKPSDCKEIIKRKFYV